MDKFVKIAAFLSLVLLLSAPVVAFAQDAAPAATEAAATEAAATETAAATTETSSPLSPLYGLGAGLALLGGAFGIARIGATSVESMARQPEAAGKIQTAMIISAALIEGVTFFALVVCMLK